MKKVIKPIGCLLIYALVAAFPAVAQEMSNNELMQEIKAMKARILQLEAQLSKSPEQPAAKGEMHKGQAAGVKGLSARVSRIEEKIGEAPVLGKWAEMLTISGVVEVEAGFERMDFDAPGVGTEESSDIALATVELGVDVNIAKHVGGHILFLWEEDDTEPVDVDEAFIILDGEDVVPLYLNAGKMYVPFGNFESHFISDPLTLEIGETRESAVRVGFANDMTEICVAVFNGDIDETGDDNHIRSFVGSATFTLPENSVSGLGLSMGVSYISNIADSDGLEGEISTGTIDDEVAGFSAFLSASLMDRFFLEAEYVGALDEFEAGELSFDDGNELQPTTWNFELAYVATETLEVALRCEGGDDLGDFLPEIQYGAVVAYSLFENTTLALEYLHGEFENDDEQDLITTQLAIEF